MAKNLAIDVPKIWIESGLPMDELVWEISKPLLPSGKSGVLVSLIIKIAAEKLTAEKVGATWARAGPSWHHLLPKDQNVRKFVPDHKVQEAVEVQPPLKTLSEGQQIADGGLAST